MMMNLVRKGVALLVLLAVVTVPAVSAPAAGSAPTTAELEMVRSKSISALKFLDDFWGRAFKAGGRSFTAPQVRVVNEGHAFYRPATNTICFNPAFFVERMRFAAWHTKTDGDMAFIIILAHEYGHAVQSQLRLSFSSTKERELQADKLAGAFARAARDAGLLDQGDMDEATYTLFTGRDATGTSASDEQAHGSGTERVDAFHTGFKGGVKAAFQR